MTQLKVNNYFFWDEISENENPDETDCPSSILKLLTPTENPKALLWRSRCKDNLAELAAEKLYQDSLTNLPLYTKIRLLTPDSKGNDIILIKDDDPAFKSPVWIDDTNGKKYKKVDIQNAGFEIISKG